MYISIYFSHHKHHLQILKKNYTRYTDKPNIPKILGIFETKTFLTKTYKSCEY